MRAILIFPPRYPGLIWISAEKGESGPLLRTTFPPYISPEVAGRGPERFLMSQDRYGIAATVEENQMNIDKYTERARGFIQSRNRWPCVRHINNLRPNIC